MTCGNSVTSGLQNRSHGMFCHVQYVEQQHGHAEGMMEEQVDCSLSAAGWAICRRAQKVT